MDLSDHDDRVAAVTPARIGRDERGVALLVVLWIFIFLFVVAFDFSAAVREEGAAAGRYSEETAGYFLALAGFQQGLYELVHRPPGPVQGEKRSEGDLFDGEWRERVLGGGSFRVRFVDEGGKININRVDEQTLRRIFTHLGIEEPRRTILVDSIMDWRDPDDLHRINGAENEYYRSLSPPYTAKNGPFDTVEDLLWVRGMTAGLFYGTAERAGPGEDVEKVGLRQIFTVDSTIDRVNLRTAPAEVLHALLGMPLEKSRAFVEERKKLSDKTIGDLLPLLGMNAGDPALQMFVFTNPSVASIEAEGRAGGVGVPRRIKAVVRPGGNRGFELVRWVDREAAPPQG
ncbi:MAG TPA: hypothetical protein VNN77_12490 [candidate division Zixibacteria bacterium]|nr:hypothetical protein [candidate division Zixibacteria bacterium]